MELCPAYYLIEALHFLRERELLSLDRMELILSWPHSGFNVHVGETVAPDGKVSITRVARYTLRASIVMSRISYDRIPRRFDDAGARAIRRQPLGLIYSEPRRAGPVRPPRRASWDIDIISPGTYFIMNFHTLRGRAFPPTRSATQAVRSPVSSC